MAESQPSAHKALRIVEIQRLVVEHIRGNFSNYPPGLKTAHTLANLARTSKGFSNIALDALWSRQSSLVPLVRLMGDAVSERFTDSLSEHGLAEKTKNRCRVIFLKREPTSSELDRVDVYARKITHIVKPPGCCHTFFETIDRGLLAALTQSSRFGPLFPNLRVLDWPRASRANEDIRELFSHFLGPNLLELNVGPPNPPSSPNPLTLQAAQIPAFSLTTLKLSNLSQEPTFPASLERMLSVSANSLLTFHCNLPLSNTAISKLSTLPNLEELLIDFETPLESPSESSHGGEVHAESTYPSLKNLELFVYSQERAHKFFDGLRLPVLDDLKLRYVGRVDNEGMSSLVHMIVDHCSTAHLKKIYIGLGEDADTETTAWNTSTSILPSSLRPFLRCLNITNFEVAGYSHFDLDDSFVVDISKSWSQLDHLSLGADGEWPIEPRVNLSILTIMAKHLPLLKCFECSFNCRTFGPAFELPMIRPGQGQVLENLEMLGVGQTLIRHRKELQRVAAYLSDLLPNMHYIRHYQAQGDDADTDTELILHDIWSEVREMHHEFTRVRIQERAWARGNGEDSSLSTAGHL